MTITNDTDQKIIIVDPRGSEAVFLNPNETEVIDPTVPNPVMRYALNEKLDFYYPNNTKTNGFYKKYRLTEKYCTDDPKESELTISQVVGFVQNPSDRFKAEEFHPIKHAQEHKH